MRSGLSLANKCLLLFGGVIVLVVLAAATAPWLRMNALVDEGQLEVARQMVSVWDRLDHEALDGPAAPGLTVERAGIDRKSTRLNSSH